MENEKENKKLSKEEVFNKALLHANNVLYNLEQAYKVKPEDMSYEEEKQLLEVMAKAKRARDEMKQIFDRERE